MKICVIFAVIIFFTYSSVLNHEFINYDDPDYVTNNPMVQAGLTPESIVWAFTSLNFSNWHPVTWLSHMLDYQLYGNDPTGPSPDQPHSPYRQCPFAVSGLLSNDRRNLEKWLRCRALCFSSTQCGIGDLDF